MLEKEIERVLARYVKEIGGIAYKFVSPGNTGVPDRIIILPGGDIWFAELKTETGILSKVQEAQIRRLKKLGCRVTVLRGVRDVVRFFLTAGYPGAAAKVNARYVGDVL